MQTIALEQEKAQLKEKLKERVPDVAAQVEDSLVDKYCHVEYTAIFRRNRTKALKVTPSYVPTAGPLHLRMWQWQL